MTEKQLMSFLKDMGVKNLISSGGNIRGCCPIHGENNPSFGVSIEKEGHPWNCFSCGNSGLTLVSLCAKVWPDMNQAAINRKLDAYGGITVPIGEFRWEQPDKPIVKEHWFAANPIAMTFRDIDSDTLEKAEIRETDNGVLVPYFHALNRDYLGAILYTDKIKLPIDNFKNRQHLFYPKMCERGKDSLIVVEGVYDALKVYDAGFDNVCAIGGATITENQRREINVLATYEIIVMPDKDAGGSTLVISLLEKMTNSIIFVADAYTGGDPGESSHAGIVNAIKCKRMLLI